MGMDRKKQCPQCGGVLPADAPEGLCPRCVLRLAAGADTDAGVASSASAPTETAGTVIGPYKLLEKIGEGGMAVVYMAEQERPLRRRVALKIIKLGMDTRQVVARFDAERQALAMMDHPNIARVFDAGATETGRPYFVMELVRGVSITEYCDQNRLSTQERLELFVPVCNAVHHAHQKGIIHRDLKPSNIMVTLHDSVPVPKVIDFGIAKAMNQRLTEQTIFTRYAEMIGTPEYMSPEQAEMSGLDIDTRTDIYSLGVVLYELLTGTLPFDPETLRSAAFAEVQRIIREQEPLRPSTRLSTLGPEAKRIAEARRTDIAALAKSLQKELEWIPLKAMRKDRTRRYRSAYEFSDDIRNYLDGRPLLAGPESAAYRLRKLLRKYRVPVATTAAIMAILLIGFVTSTYLYVRVQRAQHAVATLEQSVDADRKLSTAQRLQAEGRYKEALDALEGYLQSGPAEPAARLLHANLLYTLDRFEEAETELTSLLEGPPQIAGPAHCLLATIQMGTNPTAAQMHQQAGEALLPQTAEAYTLRGIAADGSTASAQWLSKALELDPAYYPARKARALACEAVRDYATMASDAEAMIVMRPKDALGYALRAVTRREAGQCEAALEDHNRAISLCDSPSELFGLHDQRRRTLTQMRDYQAALEDARYCARMRPDDLRSGFELLAALVLAGDYSGAREQHAQLVRHPRYSFYRLWIYRYTFRLLIAGHTLELPKDIIGAEPFSMIQKAIEQYRVCRTLGTCLVPAAFGVPGWSPDGKELAYGRIDLYGLRSGSSTSGAPLVYESGRLEALNLETGRVRVLAASGKSCAWSPDGRWIAFDRAPDRGPAGCATELWLVAATGGQPRYLASGAWPVWAGQTGQVFYQSAGGAYTIKVDHPLDKPESTLACHPYFAVSPDGRYLAQSGADKFSIVEIASGNVVATWTAPPPDGEHGMALKWAPNGKEVLMGGLHQGEMGLWSFDVEQGKAWQLFPSPVVLGSPSPDGSRIALEIRDWYGGIWLAKLDPAPTLHEAVRTARTEEQYLRQSCREFAKAIRCGTYGKDAGTRLYGFITRVGTLAESYYQKGQYDDALDTSLAQKELCEALGWQPQASCLAVVAVSLQRLDRPREAGEMLERLRRLPEDNLDTSQRNLLYEAEKNLAGADTAAGKLWRYLEQARLDEAARQLLAAGADEETRRVRRAVVEALYERGRGRKHSGGDYSDAMSDYATALQLDPNHTRALCDLAWLQAACPAAERRDEDQAVAHATRACALTNWTEHRYVAALAAVCAQVGDFASAVSWQSKAIELLTDKDRACWRGDYESRLRLYRSGRPYTHGDLWSFSTGRLLGWWKFDEQSGPTVADASGSGNEGMVRGAPQWRPSAGRVGGALVLKSGSVRIAEEAPFDVTGEISVSVWTRVETLDKWWQALVTKGDTAWRLHRSGDTECLEFACNGLQSSEGGAASVQGNRVVSDGRWHHVVATYDGRRMALYFDGALDGSCPASGRLQTNDQPVCIGDNAEQPGRYWTGWIDDVRIYSYALNEAEIAALYQAGQEFVTRSGP
jgi:serine/threonine protein kinase